MEVVCIKTSTRDIITNTIAPNWAWVYEHQIYHVDKVDVGLNGQLVYYLAEVPENVNYPAKNFARLNEVLSEINIDSLLQPKSVEIVECL